MGRRWHPWVCGLLWLLVWIPGLSWAEKRVALVIGNNAYQQVTPLKKAVNDAQAMGQELKELGFEVLLRTDVDRRGLLKARNEFLERLSGGDVAVLFYAGHGVQLQGSNYLLPVDIKAEREQDVIDEAIDLAGLLQQIAERRTKFSLAIIDACRNNPFKSQGRSLGASRGLTTLSAPNGLMVIYSAGTNEEALDALHEQDQNPNSLFTRSFIRVMKQPGIKDYDVVKQVQDEVDQQAKSVHHQQTPAIYDQAKGTFYFRLQVEAPPGGSAQITVGGGVNPEVEAENRYWDSTERCGQPECYRAYLNKYPQGQYLDLARVHLGSPGSGRPSPAPTLVTPPPTPVEVAPVGHLQINTNVAAEVWMEGKRQGESAPGKPLNLSRLPLGTVEVEARAKGYTWQKQRVEIKREQWEQLMMRLEAEPPAVIIPATTSSSTSVATETTHQATAIEPEMVFVKGGSFMMGSPEGERDRGNDERQHQVTVKDYRIGKYEVTQGEWEAVMGSNPSYYKDCGENCPVETVSWKEVQDYIAKLNAKTGKTYRLPTEAEWEYACLGGHSGDTWRYCGDNDVEKLAWFERNSGKKTHPVGQKQANGYGLYDMSGNVWEWTCSAYNAGYDGNEQKCSRKSNSDEQRVIRGGSWVNDVLRVRSAARLRLTPAYRGLLGFRLAHD